METVQSTYVAENIKYFRSMKGWSQGELAKQLEIGRNVVSAYELSNSQPKFAILTKLCALFDIKLDHLVYHNIKEEGRPAKESNHQVSAQSESETIVFLREQLDHYKGLAQYQSQLLEMKASQVGSKPAVAAVSIASHADSGKFIKWDMINIPNDTYLEIGPGVHDRLIISKEDIKLDWEQVFVPFLQDIDFGKNKVILNRSFNGSLFPKHYHAEVEHIICAKGKFKELIQGSTHFTGSTLKVESFQPHSIQCFEESFLIIVIEM